MYAMHKICAEFPEKFVRRKLALYNNKNVGEIIKECRKKTVWERKITYIYNKKQS